MNRTLGPLRPTIECAVERLLPAHPAMGPGARDANVIGYIERAIERPSFDAEWDCLRRGTTLLSDIATAIFGADFSSLDDAQQDRVLAEIARIPHPTAHRFLRLLMRLTVAGFFGDPKHGGNHNGIAWRWINFRPDQGGDEAEHA